MNDTYSLWRSTQPGSRFPSPVATGLTLAQVQSYTDLAVLPGVRYYYTARRTAADGSVSTSAEVSAVAPFPPSAPRGDSMSALRVFSTGSLFVDLGAGPIELMTLQDITFTQEFQEKELRAAPWLNMFAETRAFYGGKVELKATYATILASGLAACVAGINRPAVAANLAAQPPVLAAPGLVTVGKHAVLPAMSAQFAGQDEQGNPFTVTAARVHAPGLTLPFKLDDYAMPNVRLVADPDATDKVLVYQFTA